MGEVRFLNLEYFFNWIVELFRSFGNPDLGVGAAGVQAWEIIQFLFKFAIPILIVLLFVFWVYYHIRIIELRRYERDRLHARLLEKQEKAYSTKNNERWEKIEDLFNSTSEGDWRLAIIEADSMLEDLIVQLGYPGENLGERLKNINKGEFPDLQLAWDVHLVRNKIAHEGLSYHLAERDKKDIHNKYRRIFNNAGLL